MAVRIEATSFIEIIVEIPRNAKTQVGDVVLHQLREFAASFVVLKFKYALM